MIRVACIGTFTLTFIISVFLFYHDLIVFSEDEQMSSTTSLSSSCFARSSVDEWPPVIKNAVSDAWSKSMMFKVCTACAGHISWLIQDLQFPEVYQNKPVLKVIA